MHKILFLIFFVPSISLSSDIFDVTDYTLFHFIPFLLIPFFFGILLIGMFTRFVRRGMEI